MRRSACRAGALHDALTPAVRQCRLSPAVRDEQLALTLASIGDDKVARLPLTLATAFTKAHNTWLAASVPLTAELDGLRLSREEHALLPDIVNSWHQELCRLAADGACVTTATGDRCRALVAAAAAALGRRAQWQCPTACSPAALRTHPTAAAAAARPKRAPISDRVRRLTEALRIEEQIGYLSPLVGPLVYGQPGEQPVPVALRQLPPDLQQATQKIAEAIPALRQRQQDLLGAAATLAGACDAWLWRCCLSYC